LITDPRYDKGTMETVFSDEEFSRFITDVKKAAFLHLKLQLVQKSVDKYSITCKQLRELCTHLKYNQLKTQGITALFSKVVDKENFEGILIVVLPVELERRLLIESLNKSHH